ncbi:MAG: ATP synthase F1 subunit epsilon [Haliscomenobacteraceae bacterium CHB4]|nr:ATP synthase F1 subunit epsilon [Haliscomenobacteraceae bacterium CHB4]
MNLVILSPEKEIFSGAVKSVKVPGSAGQFEMLENHAPIVSSLAKGEVRVLKANGEKMIFKVEGGFVEMLNNEVSLLVSGLSTEVA